MDAAEPAPITIEAPPPDKAQAPPASTKSPSDAPAPTVPPALPALPATEPPAPQATPAARQTEAAPPPSPENTDHAPTAHSRAPLRVVRVDRERNDDEAPLLDAHPDRFETEVGIGAVLASGAGPSGVVGASPFFSRQVSESVFIRPGISIAGTEAAAFHATWASARLDACWRFPDEAPVQLDLCGGAELGFLYVASGNSPGSPAEGHTLPTFDLGPTAALRSGITRDVEVAFRAGAGVNAVRAGYTDITGERQEIPLVSARFELALSWVVR